MLNSLKPPITSTPVPHAGAPTLFPLVDFNSDATISTLPTLEIGDASQTLHFNAELDDDVLLTRSTAMQIFKFTTSSANLVDANDIIAKIDHSLWQEIGFSSKQVAPDDRINKAVDDSVSDVKHDYVRYMLSQLLRTTDAADLFTNTEDLKSDVENRDAELNDAIKGILANANGRYYQDISHGNVMRSLLGHLKSNEHGRERFVNSLAHDSDPPHGGADGSGNLTRDFSFPFEVDDKICFVITYKAPARTLGTSHREIADRKYLVCVRIVEDPPNNAGAGDDADGLVTFVPDAWPPDIAFIMYNYPNITDLTETMIIKLTNTNGFHIGAWGEINGVVRPLSQESEYQGDKELQIYLGPDGEPGADGISVGSELVFFDSSTLQRVYLQREDDGTLLTQVSRTGYQFIDAQIISASDAAAGGRFADFAVSLLETAPPGTTEAPTGSMNYTLEVKNQGNADSTGWNNTNVDYHKLFMQDPSGQWVHFQPTPEMIQPPSETGARAFGSYIVSNSLLAGESIIFTITLPCPDPDQDTNLRYEFIADIDNDTLEADENNNSVIITIPAPTNDSNGGDASGNDSNNGDASGNEPEVTFFIKRFAQGEVPNDLDDPDSNPILPPSEISDLSLGYTRVTMINSVPVGNMTLAGLTSDNGYDDSFTQTNLLIKRHLGILNGAAVNDDLDNDLTVPSQPTSGVGIMPLTYTPGGNGVNNGLHSDSPVLLLWLPGQIETDTITFQTLNQPLAGADAPAIDNYEIIYQ